MDPGPDTIPSRRGIGQQDDRARGGRKREAPAGSVSAEAMEIAGFAVVGRSEPLAIRVQLETRPVLHYNPA